VSTDTRPGAPARERLSLRFSARDLLSVAVFAVIFIVVTYVIGMAGIVSPLVWLLVVPVQALAGGITVMLFLTRVRHAGMLTLPVLGGLTLVIAVASFLGGLLGSAILRKHFVRAGLA